MMDKRMIRLQTGAGPLTLVVAESRLDWPLPERLGVIWRGDGEEPAVFDLRKAPTVIGYAYEAYRRVGQSELPEQRPGSRVLRGAEYVREFA
jgi:hypothetical protein